MLIDWFTVTAQLLNFLILVWLLKRFLYKPILHAIDAREQRIASALADADAKKAAAKNERDTFQQKNEAFEQQRAGLMQQFTEELKAERLRLLEEARQAANALRSEQQAALQRERKGLYDEIARRTRQEVFAITRKTLTELAGTTLEQRMVEVLTDRLRELKDEEKEDLVRALKAASAPVRVRSSFELPVEQQSAIQNLLKEIFSAEVQLLFETAPEVISGIELSANGYKLAWSIMDYLASLEKRLDELLTNHAKAQAKPGSSPKNGNEPAAPMETS